MSASSTSAVSAAPAQGRFLPSFVSRPESFVFRLFLAILVLYSVWRPSRHDRMELPAGISAWGIDFSWLGKQWGDKMTLFGNRMFEPHFWFLIVLACAGLLYVAAVFLRPIVTLLALLVLTVGHLGYWTLANSQGNTFHGSQMTTWVLIGQTLATGIMMVRQKRGLAPNERWTNLDGMLLYFSQCAIAAVYVVSAITKLAKSGGRWLLDSHYFAKSIQKVWRQNYYDDLDPAFAGISPWATWLAEHPVLARILFAPGLILELLGFMLLMSRRWALIFGLLFIGLHVGIYYIMVLSFPEFIALNFIFCVNLGYWLSRRKNGGAQPLDPVTAH